MKKFYYFSSAVIVWLLILSSNIFVSCEPEPEPVTCNCYKRHYFQHLENPIQFLFQYEVAIDSCDNWTIGDDTKTDDNGYLYNYLKVCE